jgi:hypothetical protein
MSEAVSMEKTRSEPAPVRCSALAARCSRSQSSAWALRHGCALDTSVTRLALSPMLSRLFPGSRPFPG